MLTILLCAHHVGHERAQSSMVRGLRRLRPSLPSSATLDHTAKVVARSSIKTSLDLVVRLKLSLTELVEKAVQIRQMQSICGGKLASQKKVKDVS